MTTRSRTRAKVDLDRVDLAALKLSPEVAWYLTSRGIDLPDRPPKIKTPEPRDHPGARFDATAVDRVLKVFSLLEHTKGHWKGKPLNPDPWQVAYILAPVFGWVAYDDDLGQMCRIISRLFVEVPRKNGKTTILGGVGIYLACADGEGGAEVVAAATSMNQAGYMFDPIRSLAINAPKLKPFVEATRYRVVHPRSGSYLAVVSSLAEALHGGNIHGALIDELHLHKSPALVEAIETGTGSRSQPLVVSITTADDGRQDTIYARRRSYVDNLANRTLKDPAMYGVVFGADLGDDPFSEETMAKANPGFPKSPTRKYLRKAADQAKQSPAELSTYLRLHLGIRTKQDTRYIDLETWDRNASMVVEDALEGRRAFGGLDLASTSDLCSLCWIFPDDQDGFDVLWRHWLPERAFDQLNSRTAGMADVWQRSGLITVTPGDVADYDFILEQINRDRERFDVAAVGYDRWNASQLVNDLVKDEAPMIQLGQGFASMSAPLKHIKHCLLTGSVDHPKFRHGGNALMRWQIDNLAVAMDASENVKPDKRKSGDKIDGISAAVDAMAMYLAGHEEFRTAYDDRGVEVI